MLKATFSKIPTQISELVLVAIGAVPGALIRWQAAGILAGGGKTVFVNVLGASILGFVFGLSSGPNVYLLIGVGFCGSLTTFSAWMVDCVVLIAKGEWLQALGLIVLTMGVGLGAAALAYYFGRLLRPSRPAQAPPAADSRQ